ncbi:MAG: CRTAC1 family protein [Acidobacteriota bacterium]|nr:CRTAC1 family protein [Acidobacteriota bacterium]
MGRPATSPAFAVYLLIAAFAALPTAVWGADPTPPYFTNVTAGSGLEGVPAYRVSVGDLNGDGYPDILIHFEPNHAAGDVVDKQWLYLNEPGDDPNDPFSRKFVDHTAGSGIRDNRQGTADGRQSDAAIFADVDNDGDLDIFTNVYLHRSYDLDFGTNDLLLNDGNAHFSLAPDSPFHLEPTYNTPAAVFLDYDNDSAIDLFIGNWYKPDSTLTRDQLYKGSGDGGFSNVTVGTGIDQVNTCVYAVAAFDSNGDGLMDLFAPPYSRTVFGSIPRQYQNNGDGTFTQVQATTHYDEYRGIFGQKVSFGSMPRDYDNDGDEDFFEIMTHGEGDGATGVHSTVVTNDGGIFSWDFDRVSGRAAEDPDTTHHGDHFASWIDFDGDMLVDFILTESGYGNNRLYLFRQAADHTFSPVTVDSGLNEINIDNLPPGYVTPLDYDRDGDEDLLITCGDTGVRLYRNDVGTDNNWLAIKLVGVGAPGYANKSAIGARVAVTAGGVTQTQTVYAGNGHEGPMRPLTLHFGLGGATTVDSVRVRWPNTALVEQELTGVGINQFLTIHEPCDGATDPTGLLISKQGSDLLLEWDDPADPGVSWNVYRDGDPDPSTWGAAHAAGVGDEDPGTPGIQYTDVGAASDGARWFYLVTATNVCGETPL